MNPATPAWLTPKQAAALLVIHPDTLRRYRREGSGPPFARFGRVVRYQLAAVEAWLQQRTATSTADEAARQMPRTATR